MKSANVTAFTILMVDDTQVNHLYFKELLDISEFKYNTIHLKNGKEAVDYCRDHDDIDLVLMDINMPVMDGIEATRNIKKIKPHLPVIAQTAYSECYDKNEIIAAGCEKYISKPIRGQSLLALIQHYRNKKFLKSLKE